MRSHSLRRNQFMLRFVITSFCVCSSALATQITVKTDRDTVPMGKSVFVDVTVTDDAGQPLPGARVLSYVNEKRWGAHEVTNSKGQIRLTLPLPNPGVARIQVQATPPPGNTSWIWTDTPADNQTVFLKKIFTLDAAPRAANLRAAVDDSCTVTLNGHKFEEFSGWSQEHLFSGIEQWLKAGENTVEVEARNSTGPAGFVAELTLETGTGKRVIASDRTWEARTAPNSAPAPAHFVAKLDEANTWSSAMGHWPGLMMGAQLFAGRARPDHGDFSNVASVEVTRRSITVKEDPEHLVGIQWEPWFTPLNAYWQTAQAVPVVGYYNSYDFDVMRQHALWLMDAGVNFNFVDWSNHIWGAKHWNERGPGANEIIHATTLALEAYAAMRDEGLPVPKFVIMPGLSNGPACTMEALNEELDWIYQNYLRNPRFNGLWVMYEGKPLVVPLDCGSVAIKPETPPVDASKFTVRWMGTQLQISKMQEKGYWSWMDGSLEPVTTFYKGKAEVVTPTPSYFAGEGWIYPSARGRRGGTTFIESYKTVLKNRPKFVLLHQWNEYAGQPEGQGYGPKHDIYVDSYSVELSDDLEPVSLTAGGYRGDKGGWGYYYYNLMGALIHLSQQDPIVDTILAVNPPHRNQEVTGERLTVEWSAIGKAPAGYTVTLDGKTVASQIQTTSYDLDLSNVAKGAHEVNVTAEGATTHLPL
ncbi:MAG: hypothetical protein HZB26_04240, partial [Candidatus Hydrogenedentes bacterium]|nr:hypothetical protein [Candidatus Hydrogenedentota bacterium]